MSIRKYLLVIFLLGSFWKINNIFFTVPLRGPQLALQYASVVNLSIDILSAAQGLAATQKTVVFTSDEKLQDQVDQVILSFKLKSGYPPQRVEKDEAQLLLSSLSPQNKDGASLRLQKMSLRSVRYESDPGSWKGLKTEVLGERGVVRGPKEESEKLLTQLPMPQRTGKLEPLLPREEESTSPVYEDRLSQTFSARVEGTAARPESAVSLDQGEHFQSEDLMAVAAERSDKVPAATVKTNDSDREEELVFYDYSNPNSNSSSDKDKPQGRSKSQSTVVAPLPVATTPLIAAAREISTPQLAQDMSMAFLGQNIPTHLKSIISREISNNQIPHKQRKKRRVIEEEMASPPLEQVAEDEALNRVAEYRSNEYQSNDSEKLLVAGINGKPAFSRNKKRAAFDPESIIREGQLALNHNQMTSLNQNGKNAPHASLPSILQFRAQEIDPLKGLSWPIQDFSFEYEWENGEIRDEAGTLTIAERLYHKRGFILGGLSKANYVKVNINTSFEAASGGDGSNRNVDTNIDVDADGDLPKSHFNIPFISYQNLEKILKRFRLSGSGGYLLINIDEQIDSVRVNQSYEKQVYLDDNFKLTNLSTEAKYSLFLGMLPGTVELTYYNSVGENSLKFVVVKEGEISYDQNSFEYHKVDTFKLYQKNILSSKDMPLSIPLQDLEGWTVPLKIKKLAPESYRALSTFSNKDMPFYLALKHLPEKIAVGNMGNGQVVVPSSDFIVHFFDYFKVEDLNSRCLMQINISGGATKFEYGVQSKENLIYFETAFLDENGTISDKISPFTKQIFLLGEGDDLMVEGPSAGGIVNLKISYLNGRKDFITSFCLNDKYIVEQW